MPKRKPFKGFTKTPPELSFEGYPPKTPMEHIRFNRRTKNLRHYGHGGPHDTEPSFTDEVGRDLKDTDMVYMPRMTVTANRIAPDFNVGWVTDRAAEFFGYPTLHDLHKMDASEKWWKRRDEETGERGGTLKRMTKGLESFWDAFWDAPMAWMLGAVAAYTAVTILRRK